MNALHQLRGTIQNLNPAELDMQRFQLLALVEEIEPFCPNGNGDAKHHRLSPRESEVMNMILNGRRLKEIAAVLDISVKTVTTHRSRLLRKLSLDDNLGLYRYGVRHGLIKL